MDYKTSKAIVSKINEATYEVAMLNRANRNDDVDQIKRHKENASRILYEVFEASIKNHLWNHAPQQDRRNIANSDMKQLREKFDFCRTPIHDYVNEDEIDLDFIDTIRRKINTEKHESKEIVTVEELKGFYSQIKKFVSSYITEEPLKMISDFEKINIASWDSLYTACDRFQTSERNFILITGAHQDTNQAYLKNLSIPKWDLIIDFDYNSERDGFYNCAYKDSSVTPHKVKSADVTGIDTFSKYSQSHYHYFADNYFGSGEKKTVDYRDWRIKFANKTDVFLRNFSSVFSRQKTIVVILYNSRQHINFLCEKIDQYFGANTSFVFANDFENELTQVCKDFNGIKIDISISEISEGLSNFSSNFGIQEIESNNYFVPFLSSSETKDVTGVLSPDDFAQFEEDFEVLHNAMPTDDETDSEQRNFLCGENKISWLGLQKRYDVERHNFHKKFIKPIEKLLENGRGKIYLQHDAGYGGTTVARRIAWELHLEYPTLILKKFRENKIKEKIIALHQRTRKAILVVMESPQSITLDEVDSLYKSISLARPVVFLIVKRGKPSANDLSVTDWGNNTVDLVLAYKPFLAEFSNPETRKLKEKALEDVAISSDPYKKTPFYIGLLTFEERFFAIKDYVKNFVQAVNEKQEHKSVLIYLAIVNDYLGQGLPAAFFKSIFRYEDKHAEVFYLENYFQKDLSIIDSLLIPYQEGNIKSWKIRHAFLAKEIKKQILSGSSENPEIWKQGLAKICIRFIEDSITESTSSDYIQETLQKLFIGNRKDRQGETFTNIINDIESDDDKEQVFLSLKNSYPDNPHYCSHLARFYAYHNKNSDKALKYADEAIRLSELEGSKDSLLYHIKGMCLRSIAYDLMDKHRKIKLQNKIPDESEYERVIYELVPNAAEQFELSRKIAREQNRIDEHGYVAHIQLLIRAIDYAIFISGKSKSAFLIENKDPFSDWLDLAESLLEDLKRTNFDNDESGKIEDCQNDIEAIYENYDLILQSLRNQLDKGVQPSRTRRQIVRTYFRKKDFTKDIKTVNNILNLMEHNIENEPDNEKNFFLWFQAARHSKITIPEALNKLSKWKANSSSLDAVYYYYIIKVFRALEGYSDAAIDASNLIKECRSKGRGNITAFEWYGKGSELNKLTNRASLTPNNKSEKLELVRGYFTEYMHDGNGRITLVDQLDVFFSPTQAKLTSSDQNKEVEFYLGFSYDGLRADSYSVKLVEPKKNITDKLS